MTDTGDSRIRLDVEGQLAIITLARPVLRWSSFALACTS